MTYNVLSPAMARQKLTQRQEDLAHVYTLCGVLGVNYQGARNVVKLESLGRVLRKRFENVCSHEWANTEAYERRTLSTVNKALEIVAALGLRVEINHDPRGPALKLKTKDGREFFL